MLLAPLLERCKDSCHIGCYYDVDPFRRMKRLDTGQPGVTDIWKPRDSLPAYLMLSMTAGCNPTFGLFPICQDCEVKISQIRVIGRLYHRGPYCVRQNVVQADTDS